MASLENDEAVGNEKQMLNGENDNFEDLNPRKPEIDFALCGDSIIKWANTDIINPGGVNKKVCLPGAKIVEIRESILHLHEQYDVKQITIHGGSNLVPEETPMEVAFQIIDLLSEVKVLMPNSDVYFSAILPKCNDLFSPGINEINSLVYSACNALGIKFIQHSRFSSHGRMNESYYTLADLIHLNRRGVRQFVYDIKSSLA